MLWEQFLRALEKEINWDNYTDSDVSRTENLVGEFCRRPSEVAAAIRVLLSKDHLYKAYLPHVEYPRPFMDKFVLHIDAEDRFRVRLHRFRAGQMPGLGNTSPTVHDHRWPYTTFVLQGSYIETLYESETVGDRIELRPGKRRTLARGCLNSLAPGLLHQTCNDREEETCVTFFVRGPAVLEQSRVWLASEERFRLLRGRNDQVAHQLLAIEKALVSGDANAGTIAGAFS